MNRNQGIGIAATLLGLLFILPLWQISLVVPQYPEQIGIHIYIHEIRDVYPKALRILNILNHNVGMKEIKPDEFIELKIFPITVTMLILSGWIMAVVKKTTWQRAWLAVYMVGCIAAFLDFSYWLNDFGSNLDPDAALKIEGQTYHPPLIGIKKVVNLEVHSFPHWGTLVIGVSLALAGYSIFKPSDHEKNNVNNSRPDTGKMYTNTGAD